MLGGMLKLQLSCLPVCKERQEGTEKERKEGARSQRQTVLRMRRDESLGEGRKQRGCGKERHVQTGDIPCLTCPLVILGTICRPLGLGRGRLQLSQLCPLISWAPQIQPIWGSPRAWPL